MYILLTDQPIATKFDQSNETVSVIVGKRALLPCYVSLQDAKNNGFGPFKVIIIHIHMSINEWVLYNLLLSIRLYGWN